MVVISDYRHCKNSDDEEFISLILESDIEIVQSKTTGNFYATARRCSIFSTFSEERAKSLIGKQLPGQIIKEECEPYRYTVPETGENIELSHTYRYLSSSLPVSEEEVFA
jgi:hypothetical protein